MVEYRPAKDGSTSVAYIHIYACVHVSVCDCDSPLQLPTLSLSLCLYIHISIRTDIEPYIDVPWDSLTRHFTLTATQRTMGCAPGKNHYMNGNLGWCSLIAEAMALLLFSRCTVTSTIEYFIRMSYSTHRPTGIYIGADYIIEQRKARLSQVDILSHK